MVPIWVGPQVCPNYTGETLIPTSNAYQAGVDEGANTSNMMNLDGLQGPGAYDLEPFVNDCSYNMSDVESFISGWDANLKANGFYPVLYGSTGASDLTQFASISSVPDAIYGADWDGVSNVDDLSPVPSGYWVNNQRYKQFQGNVYETYDAATIRVDNDCAGSLVWTDNSVYPTNCA